MISCTKSESTINRQFCSKNGSIKQGSTLYCICESGKLGLRIMQQLFLKELVVLKEGKRYTFAGNSLALTTFTRAPSPECETQTALHTERYLTLQFHYGNDQILVRAWPDRWHFCTLGTTHTRMPKSSHITLKLQYDETKNKNGTLSCI